MTSLSSLLFTVDRRLRNGWWVAIFFMVLTLVLAPSILIAAQYDHELGVGEQALIVFAAT